MLGDFSRFGPEFQLTLRRLEGTAVKVTVHILCSCEEEARAEKQTQLKPREFHQVSLFTELKYFI